MGVRGLTTFIAKDSKKYMEYYQLHDCYLVIDGNNLASQLYKWHVKCYDCFGGDYDKYAKEVKNFFAVLNKCNVTPLVVFDGGYENKKMSTIFARMRNRIKSAGKLNSTTEGSITVFPLFIRDLFVEIVTKLRIKTTRCDFEADYEMACIARTLNCPLLSYDSDFYIFDVLYIPFSTLEIKAKAGNYLQCYAYRVENFLKVYGGLQKENLPLIATLLGNDYIKLSVFRSFYKQLKLGKRKHVRSYQQRRISAVIKFLQTESYESAVRKILGRVPRNGRKYVAEQIMKITEGYVCRNSRVLDILEVKLEQINKNDQPFVFKVNLDEIEELSEESSESDSSDEESSSEEAIIEENETISGLEELPDWFLKKYRKALFPAWFLDIALRSNYFLIPQLENYDNICSHTISIPIVEMIYKILTSGKERPLRYIIRKARYAKKLLLQPSESKIAILHEVNSLEVEVSKKIVFDALRFESKCVEKVEAFPSNWKLYAIAAIFWVRNANPITTTNHLHALILGGLIINNMDKQNAVDSNDSSRIAGIKSYFRMDEKISKNPKCYDICIPDTFAQFQSCLYYIKYLNLLLDTPFEDFLISDFYNGTLIYNLCSNFVKRNDLTGYLTLFLNDSPETLNSLKLIIRCIEEAADFEIPKCSVKKRRKKRKNKSEKQEENEMDENNDDSDQVFDDNNMFSLLKIE